MTTSFHEFALEQLARVLPVSSRRMFGGVGIYSDGLFFALMDADTLYLKVDDSNRADFEARGLGPFMPYGSDGPPMQYYPVPADVLEDRDLLDVWTKKALDVAQAKRRAGGSRAKRKSR
jgi:DNA transformation protein